MFLGNSFKSDLSLRVSVLAISAVLVTSASKAQDATISDDRTNPVSSTTEVGTSSGTLTLEEGGSIAVSNGTALTLDGPHNLVLTGNISSADIAAGRGLLVDTSTASISGDVSLDGILTVADPGEDGTFDEDLSTDNVGVLIDGTFDYAGDIELTTNADLDIFGADSRGLWLTTDMTGDLTNEGTITVDGNRAVGIQLDGNLTGDFVNTGAVVARTTDGRGIYINGELDGAFIHRGTIQAGKPADNSDTDNVIDAEPGEAAVLIENSITNGILLDGIGADNELDLDGDGTNDITDDSSISTVGGTPALVVRNTGTSDLTIGTVDGLDYGFVHRGNISVNGTSFGLPSQGIVIEGASSTAQAVINGGIHFDTGIANVVAGDADSTAMIIGDFASVSTFNNNGTLDADTTQSSTTTDDVTTLGPGGNATALLIEQNGLLPTITNSGNILASAVGTGMDANAVLDLSGALASINNSGNILAQISDTNAGAANAINVSTNTTGFDLTNSGEILGDVRLGSGNDTVSLTGGTLTGDIFFGTGADTIALSGDAAFFGSLDFDGTLGLTVNDAELIIGDTDSLNVSSARFTGDTSIVFNVDPRNSEAGTMNIDGALDASATVNIQPVLENFAQEEQSYDLITAGSISFADATASLALADTPYLFDVSLSQQDSLANSTLTLAVRPKTAAELDIAAPMTALYDNIVSSSLELDIELERNLAGLTSKAGVEDALASMLPDISNASFNAALVNKRQFEGQLANRLSDFMVEKPFVGGGWAREVTTYGELDASISQLSGDLLSVGLGFGYDFPVSDNVAVGVSTGFSLNGLNGVKPVDAQFSSFAPYMSLYGMGRLGGFYAGVQVTGQYVSIERERVMAFGEMERLVTSTTNGWNLTAMAEAGFDFALGGLHLRPFGRIAAQSYSEGGYTEEGGDSANLDVGKRSFSQTDATFGASLGYDFEWKRSRHNTSILRPEVFYSYTKTLNGDDGPESLEAIFVGGDASFLVEIDQTSETVEQFGGAFNIFSDGAKARVHYAKEKLDDLSAHAVSINFALTF